MAGCSIVVAVHNQLHKTRLCVESLRRNTAPEHEVIFVDNGSTDGSAEFLLSLPHARVLCNEANCGVARAWNQGVEAAQGELICFCHHDVVLPPGWLARLTGEIESQPGAGVVCAQDQVLMGLMPHLFRDELAALGHCDPVPTLEAFGTSYPDGFEAFASRFARRHAGLRISQANSACMVVRRQLFEDVGTFDETFGPAYFEDLDFFVRTSLNARYNRVYVWPGVFVHHYWDLTLRQPQADPLLADAWAHYAEKWRGHELAAKALAKLHSHDLLYAYDLSGVES